MEISASQCSRCGAPIAGDAPEGFCLRCLVRAGAALRHSRPGPRRLELGRFGDYELLDEIGRGGMGHVYRARQISLDRIVALKVISAGDLASHTVVERFQIEAEAAASLDHPNIVPVYQVGEVDGWNFFSMRFVEGPTLARELANKPMSVKRAVRLTSEIARAIQHAHERGVLHRDIKPGNIILDNADEPHVTDFGLAKFTQRDTELTLTHVALGTPAYMSPEQATGRAHEVTTAADVYGLGAVFFEMLTGTAPFKGDSAMAIAKQVVELDPPRPSSINAEVPAELAVVCLKCLEKDPARRYASAGVLADDLDRFARGEPIQAMPLTPEQILWRWAKRRPQVAALIVGCILSLLAGAIGVTWQWRTAERARRGESAALKKATATVVDLYTHSGINADEHGDPTRAALWFAKAAEAAVEPARRQEDLARNAAWRSDSPSVVRAFQSDFGVFYRLAWNRSQTALIGRTWELKAAIWDVGSESRWPAQAEPILGNAIWANQADWFVSVSKGALRRTEYPSGRELARTPCTATEPWMVVSPDDQWVVVADKVPFIWEVATGKTRPLPLMPSPRIVDISPDGRWVLVCRDSEVGICSLSTPDKFLYPPVPCVIPTIPGFLGNDYFYTASDNAAILVRETRTGRQVESYTSTVVEATGRSGTPDGRFIVTSMAPLIDRKLGTFTTFPIHPNRIEQVDVSRDGSLLATACYDSVVRLVSLPTGEPVRKIGWHQEGALGVAISPDKRFLATSQAGDGLVRVWRLDGPPKPRGIPVTGDSGFQLSRDGSLLVPSGSTLAYTRMERTRVHEVASGAPVGPEIVPGGAIMNAAFAADASWVALICSDLTNRWDEAFLHSGGSGSLQFWDYRTARRLGDPLALPTEPRGLAVHPSGRWVAAYTAKRELLEIEVATRQIRVLHATTNSHYSSDVYSNGDCRYSPDGRFLIGWAMRSPPVLWDRQAEKLVAAQPAGPTQVAAVDFQGDLLSMVSIESRLEFLKLPEVQPIRPPLTDSDWQFVGRFSPEGDLFLSGGRGKVAHVWDWQRGVLKFPALRHENEVFAGLFLTGTDVLATGGLDSKIRFWNRNTGLPMRPAVPIDNRCVHLATTPEGRTLICGSGGSSEIILYDVASLLPKPGLSIADTLLLAEIDAAAAIETGGLEPLSAGAWFQKWRQFRAHHPDWHRW